MSSIVWLETWKTSSSRSLHTESVVTPLPRKREREVAVSILVIAAALAGWIVLHRDAPPPKPEVTVPRVVSETAPAQTAQASPQAPPSSTAIELVELPASFFEPPRPKTVAPAKPTPRAEPTPPPQSKPVEAKAPEPPPAAKPAEEPPPVRVAEAAPPREEVREVPVEKPIVPLKPEVRPEPVHAEAPIVALRPEFPDIKSVIPLPAEEPKVAKVDPPKPVVALQPEPPRAKPMATLKPGDEKPVVKPLETPKATALLRPAEEIPPPPPMIKEAVREMPKRVVTTPVPVPKSQPVPAPTIVADNPETAGEGRILLRLFEKGSGPGIEIRWPSDPSERDRLYDVFTRCLGMRDGIVDGDGRLFLPEGARAQPTALNTDRYSGFVRRPEGAIASDEQQEIARVRAYHQLGGSTSVARIFPRAIDAFLIGGLRQAVGETYLNTKSVRAAYRLNGSRVIVDSIVVDGRAIDGAIDLTSVSSGCRR